MNSSLRVVLDIVLRTVALLVLIEVVVALYSAAEPTDDALGTGLTALFALVCAAALWGVWDGFHQGPVRLCVTWVVTGLLVSLGTTAYSYLRYGGSWSEFVQALGNGLVFQAGLVFVPAIVCGIAQSATRRS
jgi:hypothetical protein